MSTAPTVLRGALCLYLCRVDVHVWCRCDSQRRRRAVERRRRDRRCLGAGAAPVAISVDHRPRARQRPRRSSAEHRSRRLPRRHVVAGVGSLVATTVRRRRQTTRRRPPRRRRRGNVVAEKDDVQQRHVEGRSRELRRHGPTNRQQDCPHDAGYSTVCGTETR